MLENLKNAQRIILRYIKLKDKENFENNDDILDAPFSETNTVKDINLARKFLTAAIVITVVCCMIMTFYSPSGFANAVGIKSHHAEPIVFCSLGIAGICLLLFLYFRFIKK